MKVILSMAVSANGMIATKEGSEDFLSHDNWLRFLKLCNEVGCFMWGRKTYEAVSGWSGDYLAELQKFKKIIISHKSLILPEDFSWADSPESALARLEKAGFTQAIVTGGATLNSEFAKRGLIDEVILDVNSVVVGEGIPLMAPIDMPLDLQLLSAEKVDTDIVELKYKVIK